MEWVFHNFIPSSSTMNSLHPLPLWNLSLYMFIHISFVFAFFVVVVVSFSSSEFHLNLTCPFTHAHMLKFDYSHLIAAFLLDVDFLFIHVSCQQYKLWKKQWKDYSDDCKLFEATKSRMDKSISQKADQSKYQMSNKKQNDSMLMGSWISCLYMRWAHVRSIKLIRWMCAIMPQPQVCDITASMKHVHNK